MVSGAAAGFAATLVLSALARVLPGMSNEPDAIKAAKTPAVPPADPFDPDQVAAWQARSQSPAAYRHLSGPASGVAPAQALEQPTAPGPEGLAEQFAFKVGSGLFDEDVSASAKPAGLVVHLVYGSFWGALYGILQSSYRQPRHLFGALYGLGVYAVGPGILVPAMKLMRKPWQEPPVRTAMMVGGHIIYGLAVTEVFHALEPEA
jgi:hypothetical protein